MTDITKNPVANGDDGFYNAGTNAFSADATSMSFGNSSGNSLHAFIRFPSVNIPKDAVITAAKITFRCGTSTSGTTCNGSIYYVDEDSPAAPTSAGEFTADPLSTTTVAWDGVSAWTFGSYYDTPSIVSLVQEIVCRAGWVSNNAMMFQIRNNASSSGAIRTSGAIEYSSGTYKAALAITYTANSYLISVTETILSTEDLVHNIPGIDESLVSAEVLEHNIPEINESIISTENLTNQFIGECSLADAIVAIELMTIVWDMSLTEALASIDASAGYITFTKNLAESLTATDLPTGYRYIYKTLADSIFSWDFSRGDWCMPVNESLVATDTASPILVLLMFEYLKSVDTVSENWNGKETIAESITARDTTSWIVEITKTINEALTATDTVTPILVLMLYEYLQAREAATVTGTFNHSCAEAIQITDALTSQWLLSLAETLSVVDAASVIKVFNDTLNESIRFTDVLSSVGTFGVSLSEQALLTDFVQSQWGLSLSENLSAVDTVSCLATLYKSLSETMTAVDAVNGMIYAYISVTDNAVLVDTVSVTGAFLVTVQEAVQLNVTIEIDNDYYECWVLNTPEFLTSVYSGYNFNSYCTFNNRIFAAKSSGIYELTGSTDNGTAISTGLVLQDTDFGTVAKKRFRKAYIGVSGTSPVLIMEDLDSGVRQVYSISDQGAVNAVRDVSGRKWKLSVANFDSLDSIELVPIILTKGR